MHKKIAGIIFILLIITVGLFLYKNSLGGDFIWDDYSLVRDNVNIRSWSNLDNIFTKNIGFGARKTSVFYRPFYILSFMLDYSLYGDNPQGYHRTNVILHVFNAVLLYWLLVLLFGNNVFALWTSLLFTVHPVQVESVVYISSRGNVLGAFFLLLCLIIYIYSGRLRSKWLYLLALLTFAFALLTKENTIVVLFLFALSDYMVDKKIKIKMLVTPFVITVVYFIFRSMLLETNMPDTSLLGSVIDRIPGFFVAVLSYIRIFLFPFHLHMGYGQKLFSFMNPLAILGFILSVGVLVYAVKNRQRNRLFFFSIMWFFLTLLPFSNIYPIAFYMSENYIYIPSIGFFMITANLLSRKYNFKFSKQIVSALGILLIIVYSLLTIKQISKWENPVVFFENSVKYEPNNVDLLLNLSVAYQDDERPEEAIEILEKIIDLEPYYVQAYNNLGTIYDKNKDYLKAIKTYKQALAIEPNFIGAYYNLASLFAKTGRVEVAEKMFHKIIKADADYAGAYYRLGEIYSSKQLYQKAIEIYQSLLKVYPNNVRVNYNLAILYKQQGKDDLAQKYSNRLIELGYAHEAEKIGETQSNE